MVVKRHCIRGEGSTPELKDTVLHTILVGNLQPVLGKCFLRTNPEFQSDFKSRVVANVESLLTWFGKLRRAARERLIAPII
jgi:hypothetical protein